MELRRLLLIGAAVFAAVGALGQVKRYPLDDRTSYVVRISAEAPTTILFPDKIAALDGANLSAKAEEAPVQLSHQPGANYFSVRALRPDARAAVNVLVRDRVYALEFQTGSAPDRTVTFYNAETQAGGEIPSTVTRAGLCLSLLDRAKNHASLAGQYPALAHQVERSSPGISATTGALTVIIEEVFRFPAEDTLVFRLRLENRSTAPLRYSPALLGIQIGTRFYPVAITDADGELPAEVPATVWLVIAGEPDGRRANLTLANHFTVLVPLLP